MDEIRRAVERSVRVLAVRVPARLVGAVRTRLLSLRERGADAPVLLAMPRVRGIVADPEDAGSRLVLLGESVVPDAPIMSAVRQALQDEGERHAVALPLVPHEVRLEAEALGVEEMLRAVLPADVEPPSAFETVGRLAHVNLRESLLPHARLVAAAIMAKNPHVDVVVNKTGAIEGEFRVFPMTVIGRRSADGSFDLRPRDPAAGDTLVSVREGGCVFELDFARVYWNSRLQAEHARLVSLISSSPRAALVDMFCGVGPFALPAARAGARVYANDLNPESVRWLRHNAARNRADLAAVSCADARLFVRRLFSAGALCATGATDRCVESSFAKSGSRVESPPESGSGVESPPESGSRVESTPSESGSRVESSPTKNGSGVESSPSELGSRVESAQPGGSTLAPAEPGAAQTQTISLPTDAPQDAQWHFVLNLPAAAHEFLDVLSPLGAHPALASARVHCYVFCRTTPSASGRPAEDPVAKCASGLGRALGDADAHCVRNVAPGKDMFCVSFTLGVPEPDAKRARR